MKKFLLSFAVIGAFLLYSFHQKSEDEAIVLPTPQTKQIIPQITPTTAPSTTGISTDTPTNPPQTTGYKDGTYTGDVTDAFYGNVQVQVSIQNGKISDVKFLQYPNDRDTSVMINTQAMPMLKQEALQTQNANVDIVTGATQTSEAFQQSLQSALSKSM